MSLRLRRSLLTVMQPPPIRYLFRDEFTTDRAAGAVNGSAAEPGPGNRVATDTENKLSVSGGWVVISGGKAVSADGDPGLWETGFPRVSGRALLMRVKWPTIGIIVFGFDSNQITAPGGGALQSQADATLLFAETGATYTGKFASFAPETIYDVAFVLRSVGSFVLIRGGIYSDWTLLWVGTANVAATLYPVAYAYNGQLSFQDVRVVDLPSPWTTDNGIATQGLAGARAQGDTFTHEANCIIDFTVTTLPGVSNSIALDFRKVDAQNRWYVQILDTGDIRLVERVSDSPTIRGSAAGVVANGHQVRIIADGQTIKVFSNYALRITYSSAANFATATAGGLSVLGAGAAVGNIISYPRVPSGRAGSVLMRSSPNFT